MTVQRSHENNSIEWLCRYLMEQDEDDPCLELEDQAAFDMMMSLHEDNKPFASQYERLLDAARNNTTFTSMYVSLRDDNLGIVGTPIYDAVCSLLPNLMSLSLSFVPSTTATRVLSLVKEKLQWLHLDIAEESKCGDVDVLQAAAFSRELYQCSNLEEFALRAYTVCSDWSAPYAAIFRLVTGGTFPKLKILEIYGVPLMDLSSLILHNFSKLRKMTIEKIYFLSDMDVAVFAKAMDTVSMVLEEITVNCCEMEDIDETLERAAARALAGIVSLKTLELKQNKFSARFYEEYGDALKDRHTDENAYAVKSMEIELNPTSLYSCTTPILRGIGNNRHHQVVNELTIVSTGHHDSEHNEPNLERAFFSEVNYILISKTCRLKHLSLWDFPKLADVDFVSQAIVEGFRATSNLHLEKFSFSHARHSAMSDMLPVIIGVAQNPNSRMKELELPAYASMETCRATLALLQNNKTLKNLKFSTDSVGEESLEALSTILAKNYYLESFGNAGGNMIQTSFNIILKLNGAGRCYLVDRSLSAFESVQKGVEVLIAVRESLDCLFYHLRENPALCCNDAAKQMNLVGESAKPDSVLSAIHPSPQSNKKRRLDGAYY